MCTLTGSRGLPILPARWFIGVSYEGISCHTCQFIFDLIGGKLTYGIKHCRVCDSPSTVKSHLLPRALVSDIRGDENYVVTGALAKQGMRFEQSGLWDDGLLCQTHEQELGRFDDYGVRWIRSFDRRATQSGNEPLFFHRNRNPKFLAGFVSAVIWRHSHSRHMAKYDLDTGPWDIQLRDQLFNSSNYEPRIMICKRQWVSGGIHLKEIIIPPFRNPRWSRRGWEFEVGGLSFSVILDSRRIPDAMKPFLANGQDPVVGGQLCGCKRPCHTCWMKCLHPFCPLGTDGKSRGRWRRPSRRQHKWDRTLSTTQPIWSRYDRRGWTIERSALTHEHPAR